MHNTSGDSESESNDIGGWPKIINKEPDRPHDIFDDESDETDEPNDINYQKHAIYMRTENIYAVMEAFVEFHALGLYPPKWVLDHLASKINKHLAAPDPDLLASQLGVSGRGSGSTNPYDEYVWWQERSDVIGDLAILMGGFEITFVNAARAIIEKRNLEIASKTLMNSFRELYGDPNLFHRKNREFDAFFSEEDRDTYLKEFPHRTLRFIKDKKPRLKWGT